MKSILSLVLFLVIGFIASRGLFTPPRFKLPATVLILTGVEFFFLGMLLGPNFFNLITPQVLNDLTPIAYLALGWAGLLFGIQLSWQHIQKIVEGALKFLALDGFIIMGTAAVVLFGYLYMQFPDLPVSDVVSSAAVLAVAAAISSPTIVAVLARLLPSRGRFTATVRMTTSLSAVIPMLIYGIVLTVTHPSLFETQGFISGILWWVFANALGIVMGFIFTILTTPTMSRDERLLLIIGTTMLMGGLCFFLQLSAFYTAMMMGLVVGNFSRRRVQIFEQLLSIEKTLYIAFLIFIGAMITFTGTQLLLMAVFYIMLRLVLKIVVSSWAMRASFPGLSLPGIRPGLAFTAQGGVALAVALDWGIATQGPIESAVEAVIAVAVVANEFAGVWLTRVSLRASGDVKSVTPASEGQEVSR